MRRKKMMCCGGQHVLGFGGQGEVSRVENSVPIVVGSTEM
jgi:hypothetical protein